MKTLRYIVFLFAFLSILPAIGQEQPAQKAKDSLLVRGFSAHLDIASPLMGIAVDKNIITAEIQADINLLNKFFPIVELGYASVNHVADNGAIYRAQAPFWRIGLNYNILKTKKDNGAEKLNRHYPFVGVRYGMSVINYELADVPFSSNYWNENELLTWSGRNAYAGWAEIVGGVRVDLAKGFTMGWSVRVKLLLHSSLKSKETLWYVPGYGRSSGTQFSFNYTIGFTYRTKAERKRMAAFE